MLDTLGALNREQLAATLDPEIETRIAQYEMAYRMQTSVPELTDLSDETDETFELYGDEARTPGTFAANCLLARRLAERGVRFIQLYHRGWDQHYNLPTNLRLQCHDVDQRVRGAHHRSEAARPARRHAGRLGRRVRPHDLQPGQTDRDELRPRSSRPLLHDVDGRRRDEAGTHLRRDRRLLLQRRARRRARARLERDAAACLGIDHTRLTYKFQGRYYRLTDVEGHVVEKLFA